MAQHMPLHVGTVHACNCGSAADSSGCCGIPAHTSTDCVDGLFECYERLQVCRWAELKPFLGTVWEMTFRASDDIKDSVSGP